MVRESEQAEKLAAQAGRELETVDLTRAGANPFAPVVGNGTGGLVNVETTVGKELLAKVADARDLQHVNNAQNCVNIAVAADAGLAGRPAAALAKDAPGKTAMNAASLEDWFNPTVGPKVTTWTKDIYTVDEVTAQLVNAGPGARAIVAGSYSQKAIVGSVETHVFNAVNVDGSVHFIDASIMQEISGEGFLAFRLLFTSRP